MAPSVDEQAEVSALGKVAPLGMVLRRLTAKYSLLVVLIALILIYSVLVPETFPTWNNFQTLLLGSTVPLMVALAVLVPAAAGAFDLSPGYLLGLVSIVAIRSAQLADDTALKGLLFAIAGAILTIAIVSMVNSFFVAYLQIHSLIATLGVGIAIGGLTVGFSGGTNVFEGLPVALGQIASQRWFGVSITVYIAAVAALLLHLFMAHTPTGRRIYAVGGNERVAVLNGLRTARLKTVAFVVGGCFAGLAGLFQLGQAGSSSPTFGPNLLLPAFAAVFLGATSIKPGFFNVGGTILAALVLAVNASGLVLVGVPYWTTSLFDGAALLIGVLIAGKKVRGLSSA